MSEYWDSTILSNLWNGREDGSDLSNKRFAALAPFFRTAAVLRPECTKLVLKPPCRSASRTPLQGSTCGRWHFPEAQLESSLGLMCQGEDERFGNLLPVLARVPAFLKCRPQIRRSNHRAYEVDPQKVLCHRPLSQAGTRMDPEIDEPSQTSRTSAGERW